MKLGINMLETKSSQILIIAAGTLHNFTELYHKSVWTKQELMKQ